MALELGERLRGILPPIVTPFDAARRLDEKSAERLCGHMLAGGAAGLFALGTSGEGPYVSPAEREALLRIVVRSAGGSVPVLAGVLAPGTGETIEQARVAEKLGVDAIVVAAPYYFPVEQPQVLEHFRAVRKAVDLPIVAYDIPQTTRLKLRTETVLELAAEGTIVGIKDSSGEMDGFRRLLTSGGATLRAFTGSELQIDSVLAAGAAGAVPGLANVAIEPFVKLYELCRSGRRDEARVQQEQIVRLQDVFRRADGSSDFGYAIGVMKSALRLRGIIADATTSLPFQPLSQTDVERTRRILSETGIL